MAKTMKPAGKMPSIKMPKAAAVGVKLVKPTMKGGMKTPKAGKKGC